MNANTNVFGCRVENASETPASPISIADLRTALLVMKPKPSPFPLIRVGGAADGAYLIPDDLSGVTACFSPGVNNAKDFEDELSECYGIVCHMCDKSSDLAKFKTPLKPGLQTFRQYWLDVTESDDSITLEHWVDELSPNREDDLILQIDIEGAEYRNLLQTPASILQRFRIIAIELHGLSSILVPHVFKNVFEPFLKTLDSMFVCVHAHPNNCLGDFTIPGTDLNLPQVHELTFLRRDRLSTALERELIPVRIPHPLDIARNVIGAPPLFLNAAWTDGTRPPEARIKMLEDELDYLRTQKHPDILAAEAVVASIYSICQQTWRFAMARDCKPPTGQENLTEVALGKPFFLSSAWSGTPTKGFVKQQEGHFFHTDFGVDQSITVDLGRVYTIWQIRVMNRTDSCYDRAKCLLYVLHQSADRSADLAYPLNTNTDFLMGRSLQSDTPVAGIPARYMTIFSPCHTA